jgi:1,2-diacylglycerol 3-alpha-glucosyltransferase
VSRADAHASQAPVIPPRSLRVLYISDVYFPRINGVSTSIQTFRHELAGLGHATTLVAPAYEIAHAEDRDVIRVASRRVPFDPEDRAMRWADLVRTGEGLAGNRFDLVHIQTPFMAHYAGVRLARRWRVPCVATYHTLFEEYLHHYVPFAPHSAMRAAAREFSRRQCRDLDAVIVPSIAMRETLERYGVKTPTEIIPTGIPLATISGGEGARFRAAHGIQADRPILVYVGRVAFEKNIEFLIRMLARVRRDVPDALLVICGEGPALAGLRSQASREGLNASVLFVGYLDRTSALLDCYRAADALVFASRTETQGLVLLEAMALGVPVVSTAVMGTRDIVGPGKGALVASEDVEDFAGKVVRLLRDPALREHLSAEAREYAGAWSAEATAARMLDAYFRLTDDARHRAE